MNFMSLSYSSSLLVLVFLLFSAVLHSEALINGEDAQLGEFPYIVSLRNKSGNHYCAGTLVTSTHIVTSAQCIYEDNSVFYGGKAETLKPEDISAVVGTLSRTQGGDLYEIDRFVPHPDHDITDIVNMKNDVAVIVLKAPVNTPKVTTAWSDATDIPKDGTEGITAGWGSIKWEPIQVNASALQKLTVKIQNREVCKNKWQTKLSRRSDLPSEPEKIIDKIVSENIICALPNSSNAGGCFRDVGNPLIVDNELVGFMIGSYHCASGIADLFTSWAAYRSFVQQVIAGKI